MCERRRVLKVRVRGDTRRMTVPALCKVVIGKSRPQRGGD
jgi:hypothetical protein